MLTVGERRYFANRPEGQCVAIRFQHNAVPLTHFHYDRFDTPDDEQKGKFSINFRTNPQGDVDQAVMSLDEAEVIFTRKPAAIDPKLLSQLPGTYETPDGLKIFVGAKDTFDLSIVIPGQPAVPLTSTKGLVFKTPQLSTRSSNSSSRTVGFKR